MRFWCCRQQQEQQGTGHQTNINHNSLGTGRMDLHVAEEEEDLQQRQQQQQQQHHRQHHHPQTLQHQQQQYQAYPQQPLPQQQQHRGNGLEVFGGVVPLPFARAGIAADHLTPENVASVPPPGLAGPSQFVFLSASRTNITNSTHSAAAIRMADDDDDNNNDAREPLRYLAYVATTPKPAKARSSSSGHAKAAAFRPLTGAGSATSKSNSSGAGSSGSSSSSSQATPTERVLHVLDMQNLTHSAPLLQWGTPTTSAGGSGANTTTSSSSVFASSSSTTSGTSSNTTRKRASDTAAPLSLEERLRRERQRMTSGSLTQFSWVQVPDAPSRSSSSAASPTGRLRLLVPARGSLYIQNGIALESDTVNTRPESSSASAASSSTTPNDRPRGASRTHGAASDTDSLHHYQQQHHPRDVHCACVHDKSINGLSAMDAQLSPDGTMLAWTSDGELYVKSTDTTCAAVATSAASPILEATTMDHHPDGEARSHTSSTSSTSSSSRRSAIRVSFGAMQTESTAISHGVADFVAQEEMDRYRGFWWHPDSNAILFARNDESDVPLYRILHHQHASQSSQQQSSSSQRSPHNNNGQPSATAAASAPQTKQPHRLSNDSTTHGGNHHQHHHHHGLTTNSSVYEDHRYPFAGKLNPVVRLGLVRIDALSVCHQQQQQHTEELPLSSPPPESRNDDGDDQDANDDDMDMDDPMQIMSSAQDVAAEHWAACRWLDAPREASEYLARVHWLPDGCAVAQWQNRTQTCTVLYRMNVWTGKGRTLLVERSDVWINLHHMFRVLPRPIHPDECCEATKVVYQQHFRIPPMPNPLPEGSFSFFFASERSGFQHLYLYTFCPGINGDQAVLLKSITSGNWMVESIVGVDMEKDAVYFTGTYDSALERHLYAAPILGTDNQHVWRNGGSTRATTLNGDESGTSPSPGTSSTAVEESTFTSAAHGHYTHQPTIANGLLYSATSNHANGAGNGGVRRGLSKVMHALSGKGGGKNAKSPYEKQRFQPVDFAFVSTDTLASPGPTRLSSERGMHSIVMDDSCRYFVDTSSDIGRPTTVKIFELPTDKRMTVRRIMCLYDAAQDPNAMVTMIPTQTVKGSHNNAPLDLVKCLPAPELLSFPTSDGTETLHAALYRPDARIHGPGPYPLVCAVYGGPHVQRVHRSWAQSADMRAQRLRSLGFCVVKCDNRGSSRRGLAFESAISRKLGRLEVLDQVAAVRQLIVRGLVDPARVGVYGWSYGGYLSAMCLCRAPDVFHVAVAGAPVTSWDGYDTHYTERYMGLPSDNPSGYRESAVFEHVPNMRGKLMIVHGLIDENVHFRHTTRLINKLIAAGKDYDLLIFPEERHSPRRLRDRIYMEQRIGEYFMRHLRSNAGSEPPTALDIVTASLQQQQHNGSGGGSGLRPMAGHL